MKLQGKVAVSLASDASARLTGQALDVATWKREVRRL